ncbi:MAG: Rrf2 family transcriptional regulator [Chloroflexota bacterium]|nr:Rrf2 family transcriptional regulator [Chloroflexia bacterium]MDQ3467309.1 Rrf2 family transcriptional regulator [Chloroflexota bacterium]
MKRVNKLVAALHILAHLAAAPVRARTSTELATCLQTNPVVIRRDLAALREAGIVASAKGHGGGWSLARPSAAISLRDVYLALGNRGDRAPVPEPRVPDCLIEATVARALDGVYTEAEALLLQRLGDISLADLLSEFHRRMVEQPGLPRRMDATPD